MELQTRGQELVWRSDQAVAEGMPQSGVPRAAGASDTGSEP